MNENIIWHDYLHVSMTYLVELCSGPGSAAMVHVSCLHLSLVLSCPGAGWCDDNDVCDDCINVTIDLQITGNYHLTHFIY